MSGRFEKDHSTLHTASLALGERGPGEMVNLIHFRLKPAPAATAREEDEEQGDTEENTEVTLKDMMTDILEEEGFDQEKNDINIACVKKCVADTLQVQFNEVMLLNRDKVGKNIDKIYFDIAEGKDGEPKIKGMYQKGCAHTVVPFWGRVVFASVARNLSQEMVVPLGVSNGIALFLEGTGVADNKKSTFNAAWMIKPAKAAKKKEEAASPAPKMPKVGKKKKAQLPVEVKEVKEVTTHEMVWETVSFPIEVFGQSWQFRYNMPMLKFVKGDGG